MESPSGRSVRSSSGSTTQVLVPKDPNVLPPDSPSTLSSGATTSKPPKPRTTNGSSGGQSSASIQVVVRLRPMNDKEKKYGTLPVVTASTNDKTVTVIKDKNARQARLTYAFDNVFTAFSTQEEVFDTTLQPVIGDVLRGFESTVFAYGQTGTGKTHTMEGDLEDVDKHGVIPRSANALFERLSGEEYAEYKVTCSYLEIYNEELCDLLVEQPEEGGRGSRPPSRSSSSISDRSGTVGSSKSKRPTKLEIMEGKNGPFCRGLSEKSVSSPQDVLDLMNTAQQQRRIGETKMNKQSSRSHCIFTIKIKAKTRVMDGKGTMECNGKLHMVDLAGSECAKSAGLDSANRAEAARERERMNINRSLLTLGRVISMLKAQSEGKKNLRIPYRDSKLTRVLQESLGGRCKTVIVATLSPSVTAIEESISTLNYAQSANGIVNKPVASSYLSLQTPGGTAVRNAPADGSSEPHDYKAVEDWNEMEIRLQYMQAQVEEAQGALARKHVLQQEAEERAAKAIEEKEAQDELLEETKQAVVTTQQHLDEETDRRKNLEEELADTKRQLEQQMTRAETAEEKCRNLEADLESARDTIASLQDELAKEIALKEDALSKLHDTRIDLAKTRAVLSATQTTESQLTAEATTLLGTLKESISDGDNLHTLIVNHRDEDMSKRQAARNFQETSAAVLDGTISTLADLSSSATAVCERIASQSNTHHSSSHKSLEETTQIFRAMSTHLAELSSTLRAQLMDGDGIVPSIRSTTDDTSKGIHDMKWILHDSEEELTSSFAYLRARLTDHSTELARLWSVHDANAEKALGDLERGVEIAREKMERMVSSTAEALRSVKERQMESRKNHSKFLKEWERSSLEESMTIGMTAQDGNVAVKGALEEFTAESRERHEAIEGALTGHKSFLTHTGDLHVHGIEEQAAALAEQQDACEKERELQCKIRDEFVSNVMKGIQSLVDQQMEVLSKSQNRHFDVVKKKHEDLAARNVQVGACAAQILQESKAINATVTNAANAAKENDDRAATAMESSSKTLVRLSESSASHGAKTEAFARKAEQHMAELSKLEEEIGDANDSGAAGVGIAGRIASGGDDIDNHLAGTVLAHGREGIGYLASSGGDIAHYADLKILECSATLDGMERPRPAILDRFHRLADETSERLEAGRDEVESLAEMQCATSEAVRSYGMAKEEEYEENVCRPAKSEIDTHKSIIASETTEYEACASGILSGCASQTSNVNSTIERFVEEVLKAKEDAPAVPQRCVWEYNEKFSVTPADDVIFDGLDLSGVGVAAA